MQAARRYHNVIPARLVAAGSAEPEPYDRALNVAILHMANVSHPTGWDVTPNLDQAPTSLAAMRAHVNETGRFLLWSGDCDGTLYGSAGVNVALRAWHDKIHYDYNLLFNVAGEAAACYLHIAQLMVVYGNRACIKDWAAVLLSDILSLVLYHRRSGDQWPKNKRQGTIDQIPQWQPLANKLVDAIAARSLADYQKTALKLACEVWGNPHA